MKLKANMRSNNSYNCGNKIMKTNQPVVNPKTINSAVKMLAIFGKAYYQLSKRSKGAYLNSTLC